MSRKSNNRETYIRSYSDNDKYKIVIFDIGCPQYFTNDKNREKPYDPNGYNDDYTSILYFFKPTSSMTNLADKFHTIKPLNVDIVNKSLEICRRYRPGTGRYTFAVYGSIARYIEKIYIETGRVKILCVVS